MLFLYTVGQGEDVDSVAERFSASVEDIIQINGISYDDIQGKRLLISSDINVPAWMKDRLMCFEDIEVSLLNSLMRYYINKEVASGKDETVVEFDEGSLNDAIINKPDPEVKAVEIGVKQKDNNVGADGHDCARSVKKSKEEETPPGWSVHTLQEGETMADVARAYGLTCAILTKHGAPLNPKVGDKIKIPSIQGKRYFYTVKMGDDIQRIALKFGCSEEKLISVNMLDKAEQLIPGSRLLILV